MTFTNVNSRRVPRACEINGRQGGLVVDSLRQDANGRVTIFASRNVSAGSGAASTNDNLEPVGKENLRTKNGAGGKPLEA